MISRLVRLKRRWRKRFSRTRWVARLINRKLSNEVSDEPGLVIIQIDGLSRQQMENAIAAGRMPFLRKIIRQRYAELVSFYSGLPSTTPAVQAEVMFGKKAAVPAFQFLDHRTGKTVLMYEPEAAERIANELAKSGRPLLKGGRSYSNIYAAGASEARFCAETMSLQNVTEMLSPWKVAVILVLYCMTILRIFSLALLEMVIAVYDLIEGLFDRQNWKAEFHCIPSRVAVSIVMREWLRIMFKLAIAEGAPIVYGNFLGYDEQAHRRGPSSKFAHWGLKGIDDMVRDIFRTAVTADARDYQVVIFSDHGQQRTQIYEDVTGKTVQTAVANAFGNGPLAGRSVQGLDDYSNRRSDAEQRAKRLLRIKKGRQSPRQATVEQLANDVIVTALGPLGHVYLPVQLDFEMQEAYAHALVHDEHIPLVLFLSPEKDVVAVNSDGTHYLSRNPAAIFGERHPFLDEATQDLECLLKHADSGDFVISGWRVDGEPLTFVHENGAHGSIGSEETRGFALIPYGLAIHRKIANSGESYIRGLDLHDAALEHLDQENLIPALDDAEKSTRQAGRVMNDGEVAVPRSSEKIDWTSSPSTGTAASFSVGSANHHPTKDADSQAAIKLRVMTYNIHSCQGVDGKVRPERIASVIRAADADVIALQEVDVYRTRTRRHHQADVIARWLKMEHRFHAVAQWDDEAYGLAILSRYPITSKKEAYLTHADSKRGIEARGAQWVTIDVPGSTLHLVNTHFGLTREERLLQSTKLLGDTWLNDVIDENPLVICGDLNAFPRSKVWDMFANRLQDAQLAVAGRRALPTFASILPVARIDHIFVNRMIEVREICQPRSTTARLASDHLPVVAEIQIRPHM